jgi:hypothetical protein
MNRKSLSSHDGGKGSEKFCDIIAGFFLFCPALLYGMERQRFSEQKDIFHCFW